MKLLNPIQLNSLYDSLNLTFSITQGPPGTGKTAVAATNVIISAAIGKRGLAAAQTNVAIMELIVKLRSMAQKTKLPPKFLEIIIWNREAPGEEAYEDEFFENVLDDELNVLSLDGSTDEQWAKGAINSMAIDYD